MNEGSHTSPQEDKSHQTLPDEAEDNDEDLADLLEKERKMLHDGHQLVAPDADKPKFTTYILSPITRWEILEGQQTGVLVRNALQQRSDATEVSS